MDWNHDDDGHELQALRRKSRDHEDTQQRNPWMKSGEFIANMNPDDDTVLFSIESPSKTQGGFDDDLDTHEASMHLSTSTPRSARTEGGQEHSANSTPGMRKRKKGTGSLYVPTREDIMMHAGHENAAFRAMKEQWRMIAGTLLGLLAMAYLLTQLMTLGTRFGNKGMQMNVILMIADGFGPASETLARDFLQYVQEMDGGGEAWFNQSAWPGLAQYYRESRSLQALHANQKAYPHFDQSVVSTIGQQLASYMISGETPLDELLVGTSRTRSANSLVTDSAAGATALSCGIKSFNGAIGVEPFESKPCGTVLEAAKKQGLQTGLVTTSRITHATPASFYAHVPDRDLENDIAHFLVGNGPLGRTVDIALGGGQCHFLPKGLSDSCREDEQDLLLDASRQGFLLLNSSVELNEWRTHEMALNPQKYKDDDDNFGARPHAPIIGLFSSSHLGYEIDRIHNATSPPNQPSLKDMTKVALDRLSESSSKGFFLMIEGARIDMAAHANDASTHVREILAYYETVEYVKKWIANQETGNSANYKPTLLISTADHETGGVSLARQLTEAYPDYLWYPDVLVNATASVEQVAKIAKAQDSLSQDFLSKRVWDYVGINDPTSDEIKALSNASLTQSSTSPFEAVPFAAVLADAVARRAQIGWATHGHSAADVNVYALGQNATGLQGNYENTHIADHIAHTLALALEVPTIELNAHVSSWYTYKGKSLKTMIRNAFYHESVDHVDGDL